MTTENFKKLESEILTLIENTFNELEKEHFEEYALILARAEKIINKYNSEYPFDYEIDNSRHRFLVTYLNSLYYHLESQQEYSNPEHEMLLNIQLMMYSNTWESKLFLKLLHRIVSALSNKTYPWNVKIGDSKKKFFTDHILCYNNNKLVEFINTIYDNNKRNSFAHAEYSINVEKKSITFLNNNKIDNINFSKWDNMFYKTILLNYHLINQLRFRKNNFINTHKTSPIHISKSINDKQFNYYLIPETKHRANLTFVEFHFIKQTKKQNITLSKKDY